MITNLPSFQNHNDGKYLDESEAASCLTFRCGAELTEISFSNGAQFNTNSNHLKGSNDEKGDVVKL